jgi:hypothetical protein
VEEWLVDGFTHLWAQGIEEGRKDGDGSSSEWRGTARERLLDVEERGPASEGNATVGGGTGRRVERESRRWMAAPCTAAAEGRRTGGRRKQRRGAEGRRGSEEEDERGKRPRTHV